MRPTFSRGIFSISFVALLILGASSGAYSQTSCTGGFADCDGFSDNGCETRLLDDAANCGGCGNFCSTEHISDVRCVEGVCAGACDPGFGDCNGDKLADGCETDLLADVAHCGACGAACSTNHMATLSCAGGVCAGTCEIGWEDCNGSRLTDGCETDLSGDVQNCGACGAACSTNHMATLSCAGGVCAGTCEIGWEDCNGSRLTDGCEASLDLAGNSVTGPPIAHCGACFETCSDDASNPRGSCTTDLCVPVSGGTAVCRHFDRDRCAGAICAGTAFPGSDASCQGPDSDGDGLGDAWEIPQTNPYTGAVNPVGVDINCDGVIEGGNDLVWPSDDTPSPVVPDIYLQYDFMTPSPALGETDGHGPDPDAVQRVVDSFQKAGVTLHVDPVHHAIPHRNVVYFGPDPGGVPLDCRGPAAEAVNFFDLKDANFEPKKRFTHRYAIFGHFNTCDADPSCATCPVGSSGASPRFLTSGLAEVPGNDLIVSLGGFDLSYAADPAETRTRWEAGTLMHELGHTFGLDHGGPEPTNQKPNHISSMNDRYQLAGISRAALPGSVESVCNRVDFSHAALAPLDENHLIEGDGLSIASPLSPHALDIAVYHCPELRSGAGFGPIDWNCNGTDQDVIAPPAPPIDLNGDHLFTPLSGHADWNHLLYKFQCGGYFVDGAPPEGFIADAELDYRTAFQEHLLLPLAHPRIEIRYGCTGNWVFLGSNAALPVTLFGSSTFDVAGIDLSSLRLAGAPPQSASFADKDGDGLGDLTMTFRQASLNVKEESTSATLTGFLITSQAFEATDTINTARTTRPRGGNCPRP